MQLEPPKNREIGDVIQGRLNAYRVKNVLGHGAISEVLLGTIINSQVSSSNGRFEEEDVAIKVLRNTTFIGNEENKYFFQEQDIVRKLSSERDEHIVNIYEVIETAGEYLIVMEYCENGSLLDQIYLELPNRLKVVTNFSTQLSKGIEFLHEHGIAHRDLKPENIFIHEQNGQFLLKIGDYGLGKSEEITLMKSCIGTINYMAPEMIRKEEYDSTIDTWALGCIMHELMTGQQLFADYTVADISNQIKQMREYKCITGRFGRLIKACLQPLPQMRIPVHQLSRLLLELYEDILESTNKGEDGRNNGKRQSSQYVNKDKGYDRHDDDGNEVDNNNADEDDLQSIVLYKSYREQESQLNGNPMNNLDSFDIPLPSNGQMPSLQLSAILQQQQQQLPGQLSQEQQLQSMFPLEDLYIPSAINNCTSNTNNNINNNIINPNALLFPQRNFLSEAIRFQQPIMDNQLIQFNGQQQQQQQQQQMNSNNPHNNNTNFGLSSTSGCDGNPFNNIRNTNYTSNSNNVYQVDPQYGSRSLLPQNIIQFMPPNILHENAQPSIIKNKPDNNINNNNNTAFWHSLAYNSSSTNAITSSNSNIPSNNNITNPKLKLKIHAISEKNHRHHNNVISTTTNDAKNHAKALIDGLVFGNDMRQRKKPDAQTTLVLYEDKDTQHALKIKAQYNRKNGKTHRIKKDNKEMMAKLHIKHANSEIFMEANEDKEEEDNKMKKNNACYSGGRIASIDQNEMNMPSSDQLKKNSNSSNPNNNNNNQLFPNGSNELTASRKNTQKKSNNDSNDADDGDEGQQDYYSSLPYILPQPVLQIASQSQPQAGFRDSFGGSDDEDVILIDDNYKNNRQQRKNRKDQQTLYSTRGIYLQPAVAVQQQQQQQQQQMQWLLGQNYGLQQQQQQQLQAQQKAQIQPQPLEMIENRQNIQQIQQQLQQAQNGYYYPMHPPSELSMPQAQQNIPWMQQQQSQINQTSLPLARIDPTRILLEQQQYEQRCQMMQQQQQQQQQQQFMQGRGQQPPMHAANNEPLSGSKLQDMQVQYMMHQQHQYQQQMQYQAQMQQAQYGNRAMFADQSQLQEQMNQRGNSASTAEDYGQKQQLQQQKQQQQARGLGGGQFQQDDNVLFY